MNNRTLARIFPGTRRRTWNRESEVEPEPDVQVPPPVVSGGACGDIEQASPRTLEIIREVMADVKEQERRERGG